MSRRGGRGNGGSGGNAGAGNGPSNRGNRGNTPSNRGNTGNRGGHAGNNGGGQGNGGGNRGNRGGNAGPGNNGGGRGNGGGNRGSSSSGGNRGNRGNRGGNAGAGNGPSNRGNRGNGGGPGNGPSNRGYRGNRGGHYGNRGNSHRHQGNQQAAAFDNELQQIKQLLTQCWILNDRELSKRLSKFSELWNKCWSLSPHLTPEFLEKLVTTLTKLPFSSKLPPPPIAIVCQVLNTLLSKVDKEDVDTVAKRIDLILNTIQRLKKFKWSEEKREIRDQMQNVLSNASPLLTIKLPEHRSLHAKITDNIEELEKPWAIDTESNEGAEPEEEEEELAQEFTLGWNHATVGWLSDPSKFSPSALPRMKVPDDKKSCGVYDSVDQYYDIVLRLWIGMTWNDGWCALNPYCKAKDPARQMVCQRTFTPVKNAGDYYICRTKDCEGTVVLHCASHNHTRGLCQKCANREKRELVGPPGVGASTDIYDAVVSSVKWDGVVLISQFASRKPPQMAIHWRSTSRLAVSNLVGIVKLNSIHANLRKDDIILWAEVVSYPRENYSQNLFEDRLRQDGKLAVRLLDVYESRQTVLNESIKPSGSTTTTVTSTTNPPGENGRPSNSTANDVDILIRKLQKGDNIAIIDCKTFAPEHIPVLKALEAQKRMPLPFNNGELLNLSDVKNLGKEENEGNSGEENLEIEEAEPLVIGADLSDRSIIRKQVVQMIATSTLEPIVQLRRSVEQRVILINKLVKLVKHSTLDQGQMESFLAALRHQVHCTQGPPGTGKSYLGVAITRALLIIRKQWIQACPSAGNPPILVLSYKNHAIDEFLLDLVNVQRDVRLVRIGSGCNEKALEGYCERFNIKNDPCVQQWHQKLQILHQESENLKQINHTQFLLDMESIMHDKGAANYSTTLKNIILRTNSLLGMFGKPRNEENIRLDNNLQPLESISELLSKMSQKKPAEEMRSEILTLLSQGIQHYPDNFHATEIILREWMRGFKPQPQCEYAFGERCKKICDPDCQFCQLHRCDYSNDGEKCKASIKHSRKFCSEHLCDAEECDDSRLPHPQTFCHIHACIKCLESNLVAKLATSEHPRNTCDDHKLCIEPVDGDLCDNLAEKNNNYCSLHVKVKCTAKTRKGDLCKKFAKSGNVPYCQDHQNQAPKVTQNSITRSPSSSAPGTCAALTKKNKPCKGKPLPNYNYCRDHLEHVNKSASVSQWQVKNSATTANLPSVPGTENLTTTSTSPASKNVEVPIPTGTSTSITSATSSANSTNLKIAKKAESDDDYEAARNSGEVDSDVEYQDVDAPDRENPDEYEEPEHIQHRREVGATEEEEVEPWMNEAEEEEPEPEVVDDDNDSGLLTCIPPYRWTWDMDIQQRRAAIYDLIKVESRLINWAQVVLGRETRIAHSKYREEKIRANSRAYEGKEVIGGTIVGCVTRLDTIRVSNPFAILVEEASEVLEPLLFACIGTTTCKLELIGDHRQLQPQMMQKFDFERINKMNISMFERLIRAPATHLVASNILSIQRRMRKNICDMTRGFYNDITEIQDHASCHERRIQSKVNRVSNPYNIDLLLQCEGQGREVPGISPHIYFWSHNGVEGRSNVGVSRMNKQEGEMVIKLTKYLVSCGIPEPSIAILTPYKGQLRLLRDGLKQFLPNFKDANHRGDFIRLSTVDRFQGDEADIIIISLVISSNSRTPFVKLVNRMIVLLSRARIGMYIIGNLGYFTNNPEEHWKATFNLLNSPAKSDSPKSPCIAYNGPRMGDEIPLCCPKHRNTIHKVKDPAHLQLGFCKVICEEELPCTHKCGLLCHWPKGHNSKCNALVDSPCIKHPSVKIRCTDLMKICSDSLEYALRLYQCPQIVETRLPCNHEHKFSCAQQSKYARGEVPWPECKQPAHQPYIYPDCKHQLQCTCSRYEALSKYPSSVPPCAKMVEYSPSCGHITNTECFMKQQFDTQREVFKCPKQLSVNLPRCGHTTTVNCLLSASLQKWEGQSCQVPGIVHEGTDYGSKDYDNCREKVTFIRRCGHKETHPCERAFEMAKQETLCQVQEEVDNPQCGHKCKLRCHEKSKLATSLAVPRNQPPITIVDEANIDALYVDTKATLPLTCRHPVIFRRACSHTISIKCYEVKSFAEPCTEKIQAKHPLCGHDMDEIPCHMKKDFLDWKPWSQEFMKSEPWKKLMQDSVLEDSAPPPSKPPTSLRDVVTCNKSIVLRNTRTCGHDIKFTKCSEAFGFLFPFIFKRPVDVPKCKAQVRATLACGHERNFECAQYEDTKKRPDSYTCQVPCQKNCWNFDVCGRSLPSVCSKPWVDCGSESQWSCKNGHSFPLKQCSTGTPDACPGCIGEDIEKEIASTEEESAIANVQTQIPNELHRYSSTLLTTKEGLNRFLESKSLLLSNHRDWVNRQDAWDRPKFFPKLCSWYILQPQTKNWTFDIAKLTRGTPVGIGIDVCQWTKANLAKLLKGSTTYNLVVGYGYTCRTLLNPPSHTTGNKQKKKQNKILHANLQQNCIDCVQHITSASNNLVFLAPYCVYPTHKVNLSRSELQTIVDNMKDEGYPISEPQNIKFKLPDRSGLRSQSSSLNPEFSRKVSDALREAFGEKADHIAISTGWSGNSVCDQAKVPESVEKELQKKLTFASEALKQPQDNEKPFSGINYLEQLKNQTYHAELLLFMCLEFIHRECFDDAKKKLQEYVDEITKNHVLAHPLLLLAVARLYTGTRSIAVFSEIFAAPQWLTKKDLSNDTLGENLTNLLEPSLREKWEDLKQQEGRQCKAMDELLDLTGLQKVKLAAFEIYKSAIGFQKMDPEKQKKNPLTLNYVFVGNPGTGKTTVARLFARILYDSGMRKKETFSECSAQKLKDDGPDKFRALVQKAMDGVLFIDEAYDLDPKGDPNGKPIVSELLTITENQRDRLSVILAGYQDDMNTKFFSYNDGLKSRFEEIHFDDLNKEELKTVWEQQIKSKEWQADPNVANVVSNRLAVMANKRGFGNAREVRKVLERATKRAMSADRDLVVIEDVLGESPSANPKLKGIISEIHNKTGWRAVKQAVEKLVKLADTNYKKEMSGQPPYPISVNRLFLGNPGTGKTTCAKLYGQLLKELNFLSIGDVVSKTASDFTAGYVGQSAAKTNEILKLAAGKVLIIDEAYALTKDSFGTQVLDVLVEKIQGTPSDDIAVLLLGYKDQMEMIRKQNPGLARRFPLEQAFVFEDYTDDELLQIFQATCKDNHVGTDWKVCQKAVEELAKQRAQSNFGNAGSVANLVKTAIERATAQKRTHLIPEDIGNANTNQAVEDPFKDLDKLYNIGNIREELIKLQNRLTVAQREGDAKPPVGHFVFSGAPGTGKTTVARLMAQILNSIGCIGENKLVDTSALKLTGDYVGQTKTKVKESLDAAKGGVLFIDEAYELGKGMYGEEALTTILEAMTSPTYKGLVIIIAGYPTDIDKMLSRNVGLKSRFTQQFTFNDWKADDSTMVFIKTAKQENFAVADTVPNCLRNGFEQLLGMNGWANARDVNQLWSDVKDFRAQRVVHNPEIEKTITADDVQQALDAFIKRRKQPTQVEALPRHIELHPPNQQQHQQHQQPAQEQSPSFNNTASAEANQTTLSNIPPPKASAPTKDDEPSPDRAKKLDTRDDGVSDEIWKQLEEAKRKFQEKMERLKKEKSEAERREIERKLLEEQEKIRKICPCPANYQWYKMPGGWRCGGGSHFVSDKQLNDQFTV